MRDQRSNTLLLEPIWTWTLRAICSLIASCAEPGKVGRYAVSAYVLISLTSFVLHYHYVPYSETLVPFILFGGPLKIVSPVWSFYQRTPRCPFKLFPSEAMVLTFPIISTLKYHGHMITEIYN